MNDRPDRRSAAARAIVASLALAAAACSPEPPPADERPARAPAPATAAPGTAPPAARPPAAAPEVASAAPGALVLPGVRSVVPEGWVTQTPSSDMRTAQFLLAAPQAQGRPAELVVFYFGRTGAGDVQSNMSRWIGEFQQPDGRPSRDVAVIGQVEGAPMKIDRLDVSGTYAGMQRGASSEPGFRVLAAIVATEVGPYYLKLAGPAETVAHWEASFDAFLRSMEPAPAGAPAP